MGMAASQARFLQLTARRSNIEYQGQQINQQRLALANASAGLFEKMLTLAVPTPPSSQDDKYYKQGYNFTDPVDDIQKKVSWVTISDSPVAATRDTAISDLLVDSLGVTVTAVTTGNNTSITFTSPEGVTASVTAATIGVAAGWGVDPNNATEVAAQQTAMDALVNAMGIPMTAEQRALGYTNVIRNVTIEHNIYDPDGNFTTSTETGPAVLQFDNLNRLLNVTLLNGTAINMTDEQALLDGKTNHIGAGESLTYASVFDQVTYQNDVNKYEFQKAAYDYQIERINAETKQVQVQDKSLELKMKQLDTEHNAVQTEMEAVQKVINKNIESSFKTFA